MVPTSDCFNMLIFPSKDFLLPQICIGIEKGKGKTVLTTNKALPKSRSVVYLSTVSNLQIACQWSCV